MNTEIKYITFDEVLNSVRLDLRSLEGEGMIEAAQLIKVVQRIHSDLGLKLHQIREDIVEICNGKGKLPNNFYVLKHAALVGHFTVTNPYLPTGRRTENVDIDCPQDATIETNATDPWFQRKVYTVCDGQCVKVVEESSPTETREYVTFQKLRIKPSRLVDPNCMNIQMMESCTAQLRDGYIYTSFPHGKVYMTYLGTLEDEEGNLLLVDHPILLEYYETAIKNRILENLYYSNEDVAQKLGYSEKKLNDARFQAKTFINTPDFRQIQEVVESNRKQKYNQYYSQFMTNLMRRY